MNLQLPTQQAALYQSLFGRSDVAIETLYAVLYPEGAETVRVRQQQILGPIIVRLNRRIREHKLIVKPGALKGTYTLLSI